MTTAYEMRLEHEKLKAQNRKYKNTIANFVGFLRLYTLCMIVVLPIALSSSKNKKVVTKKPNKVTPITSVATR